MGQEEAQGEGSSCSKEEMNGEVLATLVALVVALAFWALVVRFWNEIERALFESWENGKCSSVVSVESREFLGKSRSCSLSRRGIQSIPNDTTQHKEGRILTQEGTDSRSSEKFWRTSPAQRRRLRGRLEARCSEMAHRRENQ